MMGILNWYDYPLRNYDPQIGRWIQQDPYDQYASPYVGLGNDPMNGVDEDGGLFGLSASELKLTTMFVGAIAGGIIGADGNGDNGGRAWAGVLIGAGAGTGFGAILNAAGKIGNIVSRATLLNSINKSINTTNVGNADKDIKNTPTEFTQGKKIPVKDGNKNIGFIVVSTFQKTAYADGHQGVEIELKFKKIKSNLKFFNWIQAIRTNKPKDNAVSPYNDPQPPDDSSPFYYTEEENQIDNTADGYDARFYDSPRRISLNTSWEGELSLVAADDISYVLKELITLRYGFTIDSKNKLHVNNIKIQKVSDFQQGMIQKAKVHFFEVIKEWLKSFFEKYLKK